MADLIIVVKLEHLQSSLKFNILSININININNVMSMRKSLYVYVCIYVRGVM